MKRTHYLPPLTPPYKGGVLDLVIVGAGPAGLSAAMQAKRQGLNTVVFEKGRPGGQILAANLIENFPGVTQKITGPEFVRRLLKQATSHSVEICHEEVRLVSKERTTFRIKTPCGQSVARAVIIASGLRPKKLGIKGEEELFGRHIFAYQSPSLIPCKGKDILILGSGDAAFDQALNFSGRGATVKIVIRGKKPHCAQLLQKGAANAGIEILRNNSAKEFIELGNKIITVFDNNKKIEADYVITCIGKEKRFDFIDPHLMDKNTPGLFFAGDCKRELDRHIVIACGDGVSAAMAAAKYITSTCK